MWYSELINENDGIESILSLFETEEDFIKHYFSSILFFKIEDVKEQSIKLSENIKNKEKIPVRFSKKSEEYFYFVDDHNNKIFKTFKTRKEAHEFSSYNDLFYKENNVNVITDKDGNYYVRNVIRQYTGYRVSQGAISDYKNYTISHIWGNTSNPYFFISLWNISLIPQTFSFILDKSKASSSLVKKIKRITEILHIKLYDLKTSLNKNLISEENNFEKDYSVFFEENRIAQSIIDNKLINFLEPKEIIDTQSIKLDITDIVDEINKNEKNKDFIFRFLEKLKEIDFQDFDKFTSSEETKDICRLSYPILVDVTGESEEEIRIKSRPVKSDVYYKKPLFEWNNKQYIVCNDWKNWHRKMLISWLTDQND